MMNSNFWQLLVLALGVCTAAGAWASDDGMKLKSETDQTSYALGYQIGGDFQRQRMMLNEAAMVQGFADAQAGATPLMSEESIRATLIELKRKVVAQERAAALEIDGGAGKKNPEARNNAATGMPQALTAAATTAHAQRAAAKATEGAMEFFSQNVQQKGIVALPSGLQYRVIREGTGKQPQASDKVALIYHGTFVNGNEFGNTDQAGKHVPKIFALSALVPGMREAISHMKEGAQWQVFVPPQLGFDARTPLYRKITVFDVELVAVNP